MTAVAARVLNAEGMWVAPTGDVTLFFALSNFGGAQVGREAEELSKPDRLGLKFTVEAAPRGASALPPRAANSHIAVNGR